MPSLKQLWFLPPFKDFECNHLFILKCTYVAFGCGGIVYMFKDVAQHLDSLWPLKMLNLHLLCVAFCFLNPHTVLARNFQMLTSLLWLAVNLQWMYERACGSLSLNAVSSRTKCPLNYYLGEAEHRVTSVVEFCMNWARLGALRGKQSLDEKKQAVEPFFFVTESIYWNLCFYRSSVQTQKIWN